MRAVLFFCVAAGFVLWLGQGGGRGGGGWSGEAGSAEGSNMHSGSRKQTARGRLQGVCRLSLPHLVCGIHIRPRLQQRIHARGVPILRRHHECSQLILRSWGPHG